jgi:hypothetical protein
MSVFRDIVVGSILNYVSIYPLGYLRNNLSDIWYSVLDISSIFIYMFGQKCEIYRHSSLSFRQCISVYETYDFSQAKFLLPI